MPWSADEQVYYTSDGAWALRMSGATQCLGKAEDVLKEHPLPKKKTVLWHRSTAEKPQNTREQTLKGKKV